METSNIKDLTTQIAQLIAAESNVGDLASIKASLEKINGRLDALESSHSGGAHLPSRSLKHPSLEKLKMLEGLADQVFGNEASAAICGFEPGNKPCDHCSMCNSRGF
ncbi:MAG: hypothetical protein K1X36_08415 [Pyrinomonadaceae bacterium]|nr:hypothetical protein [Pyrinomonadaceae bacterium]